MYDYNRIGNLVSGPHVQAVLFDVFNYPELKAPTIDGMLAICYYCARNMGTLSFCVGRILKRISSTRLNLQLLTR